MIPRKNRRVLLKLSGEVLMGKQGYGIDAKTIKRIAGEICKVSQSSIRISIVIGGGNIFRGLAGAASGMNRVVADHMGMLATMMNAMALREALLAQGTKASVLSALAVEGMCERYSNRRALECFESGDVVIFSAGTGNPFFTTDTAAVLRGIEIGCDVVMKATKVDGIYSTDPATDPSAKRYDRLSYDDILTRKLDVMDATAIALARDNAMPIVVFSIQRSGALKEAIEGRGQFTTVVNE
jgi:uridylate kinase